MSKVVIIYSSLSGNTEKMAKAVEEGAVSSGATVTMKKAPEATAQDVIDADAVIMGTPNFSSYMSGMMKDFFDRNLFGIRGKCDGKPYATFGSYGGGGEAAIEALNKMIDGLGLKKAMDSVGAQREPSDEALSACKALGGKMAML
jgi:flavorubredoxin